MTPRKSDVRQGHGKEARAAGQRGGPHKRGSGLTGICMALEEVLYLKYPRRVLTASKNEYTEVFYNLIKAQWKWARMIRILGQEGSDARTSGKIYKAVIQETLLFG